jgi:DNA helicase HerA-like ATPase
MTLPRMATLITLFIAGNSIPAAYCGHLLHWAYYQALSPSKQAEFLKTHLLLGYQPETYDHLRVPEVDRYAGMYVCGIQGVGKSGLLENMVAHDAKAGNSIIVLDAHGDMITYCLAQLPPDRLAKTYLLDMEDEQFPFGVNVFATGKLDTDLARTQAVERIMHIFEVLWDDVLKQQNLPRYVRAATITLLANPGSTLVDMYAMLTNESYRARLLSNVTDTSVTQFWKTNFEDLSPAEQLRRVQPLINRLEALFNG